MCRAVNVVQQFICMSFLQEICEYKSYSFLCLLHVSREMYYVRRFIIIMSSHPNSVFIIKIVLIIIGSCFKCNWTDNRIHGAITKLRYL